MANPRYLIEQLIKGGMTEVEITDSLRSEGIEVTAATINRIKTGAIRRTGFDIGLGLMRLHEGRQKTPPRNHVA